MSAEIEPPHDPEQHAAEMARLRQERIDLKINMEASIVAMQLGFAEPSLAGKMIDRKRLHVNAEDGEVVGVANAVHRLARERPGLVGARSGAGSPAAMTAKRQSEDLRPDPQESIYEQLMGRIHYPM